MGGEFKPCGPCTIPYLEPEEWRTLVTRAVGTLLDPSAFSDYSTREQNEALTLLEPGNSRIEEAGAVTACLAEACEEKAQYHEQRAAAHRMVKFHLPAVIALGQF